MLSFLYSKLEFPKVKLKTSDMELDYSRQYDLIVSVTDEQSKTSSFNFAQLIDFDLKPNSSFLVEHEFYGDSINFNNTMTEPFIINCNLQTNGVNSSNKNERYAPINVAIPTIERASETLTYVKHIATKNKFICQNLSNLSELRLIYYNYIDDEVEIYVDPNPPPSNQSFYMGMGVHKFKFILIKDT